MAGTTREWVDFFHKAGIPSEEAASYALIFSRNRIQKNMLIDLNKEYLKDMGITLLGDVIAILKHAKKVHDSNSRAWILSESEKVQAVQEIKPAKPASSSGATVKQLLEIYQQKYEEVEKLIKQRPKTQPKIEATEKVAQPKKVQNPEKTVIRLNNSPVTQKLEVPLQKKWKVLPEHEGGYKITMPKKSAKTASQTTDKTTVFARLGEGAVSSTTVDVPSPAKKVSTSIFSRLGDLSAEPPSVKEAPKRLHKSTSGLTRSSASMRADEEMSPRVGASNKRTSQKDFLRTRDLKMLKITTEFSDEDDVEHVSLPVSKVQKLPDLTTKPKIAKRRLTEETDSYDEELFITPPPKKVRFGGTSMRYVPGIAAPDIVPKKKVPVAKVAAYKIKQEPGVKARIGLPSTPKPISKMVSDSMPTRTDSKLAVRGRINLKTKSSVLDRLG